MPFLPPLLRAEWRHLAILNYEIDPAVLGPFVPRGTQLDLWEGRTYVSVVGFLFLKTRVFGVPVPFHRRFEEVNLRFYVRREAAEGCRRGVVFIKEIVPRLAIAWGARTLYNENYICLPMGHDLKGDPRRDTCDLQRDTVDPQRDACDPRRDKCDDGRLQSVSYNWRFAGRECRLRLTTTSSPAAMQPGCFEEFIAEHYWGYCVQRDGGTVEYRVEHPRWRVAAATEASLDCDVAGLYGRQFEESLAGPPASAMFADGSEVAVYRGVRLPC